ncbi:MAG TPA: hypothetical protein PK997_05355 [Candidatus Omnitrophota bacterium]|jgi:cbb3-type cytochrome oxidase subunit 3|nr:MAG: hypothetical protein BWY49_00049 [Candidatus Omnitrophica bacterium ADurb.Bin314]HOE68822.1 hypothetical protein [Candidatus Omnitrophota bacterium]HQB94620.1 hypothetical protein [Candidatus Omnitrophota bacterium]
MDFAKKLAVLSAVSCFLGSSVVFASLSPDPRKEAAYENALQEADQQDAIARAQATLGSLFGKNAVIAVPAQLAGGVISLPPGDVKNKTEG